MTLDVSPQACNTTVAGFFSCGEQRDSSVRQSYNLLYTLCLRVLTKTLMCNLIKQECWKI